LVQRHLRNAASSSPALTRLVRARLEAGSVLRSGHDSVQMTDGTADREPSRLADWRVKAALLVAGFEGLLLLFGSLSRWVVIAVAVPLLLAYLLTRKDMSPGLGRDLLWVAAASQALAVVTAIIAFFVGLLFLVLLGLFAAVALVLIFSSRPDQTRR
jgi:hypothetical protein